MLYAIWYPLHNLKNMKDTHGGVLLLVKPATLLKITLLHGCFSRFLNSTNGTKLGKASHLHKFKSDSLEKQLHFRFSRIFWWSTFSLTKKMSHKVYAI